MKPLSAYCFVVLLSVAVATSSWAQACTSAEPKPLHGLVVNSRGDTATLIGFDEFASSPARKFRKSVTSGTIHLGRWNTPGCPNETPTFSGTSNGPDGAAYQWTVTFDPATKQASGQFTRSGGYDPQWYGGQYVWQVEAGLWIGSNAFGEANIGSGTSSATVQRTWTLGHDTVVTMNWNGRHSGNGSAGTFSPNSAAWTIGGASELWRDDWSISSSYDGLTGALTAQQNPVRHRQASGGYFPLSTGGTIEPWIGFTKEPDDALAYGSLVPRQPDSSNTTRRWQGANAASGNAPGPYFRASGTVEIVLSDEDTPRDAITRATTNLAWGAAADAFRQPVDREFEIAFREAEFSVPVDIACAGRYRVIFHVEERPHGDANATPIKRLVFVERDFASGRHTIKGRADVANMTLTVEGGSSIAMQEGRDYRIVRAEIASASCAAPEPGGVGVSLRSVHVALSLGAGARGGSAGELFLDADTIDASLYSPAALQLAQSADSGVTVVRDAASALRQIKAPALLADVAEISGASAYQVRFFSPDTIGEPDASGLYAPTGTAFAVVKFENPEPDNPASGKLKVTETRGSRVRVSTYSRSVGAGGVVTWKLERGDGTGVLATEEMVVTTVSAAVRTERTTLKRGATADSVTEREITTFAWGEETTKETLDPDGAALATVSTFYATESQAGYRQLATRTSADGSWEKRFYDATGRIVRIVRPFLNSASTTAEESEHRVTETVYSAIAATAGDGDATDEQLTTVTEKTAGQVTGRSFVVVWSKPVTLGSESFSRRSDIVATSAGAEWNTGTNLVTETLTYATGPHTGRVRRVVRPDGTATLTAYSLDAAGALTAVTVAGQLDAAGDAILDGTRVTTVTNPQGHVVSEASHDIAPGRPDLALASWDATATDNLGRPTSMLHHDGLVTTRDYACCGLLNERGRDGVLVTYDYDALGRRTHETRGGVTVRTDYDAAGRVLALVRLGGAGDEDDITLQSNRYDLAGRLYEQRDARNRLATFAESTAATGITTRTTTQPDLGTTVETRARDGSRLTVSGSAAAPRNYAYTIVDGVNTTTETRVGEGGATTEWTRTTRDFAGRPALTITPLDTAATPATATASQHYNAQGQLARSVDPDGVATLYTYDVRGELSTTALDLDRDSVIDFDGTDRITRTTRAVATRTVGSDTFTVSRSTTAVWDANNSATATPIAIAEETPGGLRSWQTVPGPEGIAAPRGLVTSSVVTIDAATETRTVVTTAPDQTVVTQTYVADRLASETVAREPLGQLRSISHQYDAHGRLWKSTDARNGTATYTWFDDDQLETVLTPDPDPDATGPGNDAQTTTFGYDDAGRRSTVTHADNAVTTTTYYPTGQTKKISGARTYPVEHTYDPQGRLKTLETWQNFAAQTGAAITTWNYHPATGRLAEKKYAAPAAGQPQPTLGYTYTAAGRLETRTGGRGLVTTYGYTAGGDLETLTYSDTTPAATFGYDRRGRLRTVADAAGSRTLDYDLSGPLAGETYAAGPGALAGLAVDRTFDSQGRLGSISALSAASVLSQIDFGYDLASRLKTVSLGTSTATYTYEPNSALLAETVIDTSGLVRLTTTRAHDKLDRLRSIAHTPRAGTPVAAAYSYNAANQRTRAQRENATAWDYGYDALGQLATARQALVANDTTFAGRDFGYTFDDIGNRRAATRTTAAGTRTSTYTPDLLNRYTQRTVPGVAEALGGAVAGSTVTLDSSATGATIHFTDRDGESFRGEVPVDNAAAAQYPELTVTAVKNNAGPLGQDAVATLTRRALVPKSPEVFVHDADGNLTADGQWSYTWDAENRLIAIETLPALVAPDGPLPADRKRRLEYLYDAQHRRIARKAYSWSASSGSWILGSEFRYLYDGWQVIAEFAYNSSTLTFSLNASYAWGLDLSGTLQGAGGVGGLLFARLHNGATSVTHTAACDANGNMLAYYDAATGERTARFEYGPFGEPLVDDGVVAESLTYRFSTKPRDPLTGTYYYGFRHYSPTTGRWLSGDPIEEEGGINLYGFVENDPASNVDSLGLEPVVDPRLPGGFRDSKTGRATKDPRKGIEKRGKAFEKALRYAYDKYSEAARQSFVDRGRQACESQARLRGTCGKCCVIDIFWVPSGPELENKVYFYAGAFLANEACTIARQRIERYGVIRTPRPRMATDDTVYLDW